MKNNILENLPSPENRISNVLKHKLRSLISKICFRAYRLAKVRLETLNSINNLNRDLRDGALHRSGYTDHYSESTELAVLARYKNDYSKNTSENSEVVFRANHVLKIASTLIKRDPEIKNLVNFGCSYGWLENQISLHHPHVQAWGVDRSREAMRINSDELGRTNCFFIASDIFEFIEKHPDALKNCIFLHINIGVYFLPTFIKKLYSTLHAAGARHVIAFEPSGISHEINNYFTYSLSPKKTVVFRGPMLINNYPQLLQEAGFDLEKAELLRPPHPQQDFRSACFVARRSGIHVPV